MNFPVLSVITFTPLVAALVILLIPAHRKDLARSVALAAAIFALILSIWVYFSYNTAEAGYQFQERYNWLPALGISLYFGVDGISTPLLLLTGVVMITGVQISWGEESEHV
jgi:NADH-quinone oxidoreductase subunit M